MKKHKLFTRTAMLSVSLLMAATFLPPDVCAKKSKSDSQVTESKTDADSTTDSSSTKKKTTKSKTTKAKSSSKHKKQNETTTSTNSTDSTTTTAVSAADKKTDEVLHQVSSYYLGLKSWKTRLIQKLVASSDTKTVELVSVVDVGVKQPNKIAVTLRAGMPGGNMVSDGDKSYFYSQILNKYNVKPAPSDLEKLFSDVSSRYVNGPYSLYSLLPSLVSKDPYASIMAGVKKAEYIGAEDVEGTSCHHIRFTQDKFSWDLWVDAGQHPWIVKVSPDLFADLAGAVPKSLGKIVSKSTKMSLTFRYKNWIANPSIKNSFFDFVPPPESTETKSFAPETTEEKPEKVEKSSMVGQEAPDFTAALSDGKEFHLKKHKDKDIVVLDFWASWCPPCRESLPILSRVTKAFSDKHVVFYPVNVGEGLDRIKEYLTKANLDVVAAVDGDRQISKLYGVNGIPQTVIIDKKGIVRFLDVGYSSNMEKRLTSDLESLVQGSSAK